MQGNFSLWVTMLTHLDRSSIGPVLITLVLIEIPTLILVSDLLHRSLLSWFLPASILIFDIACLVALSICVYTDPGILPQNVNNYEWDE